RPLREPADESRGVGATGAGGRRRLASRWRPHARAGRRLRCAAPGRPRSCDRQLRASRGVRARGERAPPAWDRARGPGQLDGVEAGFAAAPSLEPDELELDEPVVVEPVVVELVVEELVVEEEEVEDALFSASIP